MAINKKTIRLLLLEQSQNEAERIVSLFRNAGHATRVHRVCQVTELEQALTQSWDLFIAAPSCDELSPEDALMVLQKTARDTSFIMLLENNDSDSITEALELGANDAVPMNEDERLILVAKRELANLEERRQRREAELALHEVQKRCQLLLDSSMDAISYVHDGMHIYANRTYLNLFEYADADALEGMPMIDLIDSQDHAGFKDFLKSYGTDKGKADFMFTGVTAAGESFKASMSLSPAQYDGEPCIQVVIRTASDNAELEEKLREISTLDSVTNLFNRQHFLELMDAAADRTVRDGEPASLAYIQLDNFANLQADIGIAGIDTLLTGLAVLAREALSESALIARFADDAFTVIHPNKTPEQVQDELTKLLQTTEAKLFDIDGRTAQVTLSIGAALLSEKTPKAAKVLERARRCADEVESGNGLKIHNPADDIAAAASRGDVQAMVQQALDKNEFRLLFQPVVSLRGDSHEHYEVLLRLVTPAGKEISPADFMTDAINAGLAGKVDRWVLLNAIKALTEHRTKGHDTRLFIHISSASLQDPSLLAWLTVVLKAARLPAQSLIIQIRETDAVTYLKQAKQLAEGLIKLDCQIAIVQFGCAVNPLNTLKHMQVDFVKMDGSFTQEIADSASQAALLETLSELHAQSKQTIIPMVESASVLTVLWQAGVHYIQGYYLQQPAVKMSYEFTADDN